MNLYTLILIFLWAFVGLLIIGIFFLTFLYGRLTVKDNPNKAIIFIKTGRHVGKPIKGYIDGKSTNSGCKYKYNNNYIFVPHQYGDVFYCSKRLLFLNRKGQLIPMPFDDDLSLSEDEKAELIYELCESHIGADSIRALKGKQSFSIILIGVVAFVLGILAVISYTYISDVMAAQQIPSKPPTTQEKPVEVK